MPGQGIVPQEKLLLFEMAFPGSTTYMLSNSDAARTKNFLVEASLGYVARNGCEAWYNRCIRSNIGFEVAHLCICTPPARSAGSSGLLDGMRGAGCSAVESLLVIREGKYIHRD